MTPTDLPLDIANAPPTLFLFGLAGCGKSYVGNLIGEHAGWHVYHADDDLTDDLDKAVRNIGGVERTSKPIANTFVIRENRLRRRMSNRRQLYTPSSAGHVVDCIGMHPRRLSVPSCCSVTTRLVQ